MPAFNHIVRPHFPEGTGEPLSGCYGNNSKGLGGALDAFSGDVPRAPIRWRKSGFEWLFRLIHEPERIFRMLKLPLIVFAAVWNRIKGERETWQRES